MSTTDLVKDYPTYTDMSLETVDENTSFAKMLSLIDVPPGSRILEIGCATGYFSRLLKSRGYQVTGLEVNPQAAEQAREVCVEVHVADLDQVSLVELFKADGGFDVICFGDVLEHLKNPSQVLVQVMSLLKDKGYIVASVPNVAHSAVRLSLFQGDFDYTPYGILDESHLRFYTRKTLFKLFEDAGFGIHALARTTFPLISDTLVVPKLDAAVLDKNLLRQAEKADEALTLQFIVRAYPQRTVETSSLPILTWENTRLQSGTKNTASNTSTELKQNTTVSMGLCPLKKRTLAEKMFYVLSPKTKKQYKTLVSEYENLRVRYTALEKEYNALGQQMQEVNTVKQDASLMFARVMGKLSILEVEVSKQASATHRQEPSSYLLNDYLELMEASLTGTLFNDPTTAPWQDKKTFDKGIREVGLDWPAHAMTMIGTARMKNLRHLTESVLRDDIPGDFIETGVWRGGACIFVKGILNAYNAKNRQVWVADSFCGLPEPSPELYPADKDAQYHSFPQLAVSLETVRSNFQTYGLLDDSVKFLKGWFKDTLPSAPIGQIALLRLDGDMYESTMDALNALYHKVSPGGYIIVDDYMLKECEQAITDFRNAHHITDPIQDIDTVGIYWRKTS